MVVSLVVLSLVVLSLVVLSLVVLSLVVLSLVVLSLVVLSLLGSLSRAPSSPIRRTTVVVALVLGLALRSLCFLLS